MIAPRRAIAVALVGVALIAAPTGCTSSADDAALCRSYDRVVAADDAHQIELGMTTARVRSLARQQIPELRDLAAATNGRLRANVEEELAYRERFVKRLLERWEPDAGQTLWAQARAGDHPPEGAEPDDPMWQIRYAVEAVVASGLGGDHDIGAFRSELEQRCHDTTELPTGPIEGGAPGEILTINATTDDVLRFRPDGTRLGRYDLPEGVVDRVRWIKASPDGRRLLMLDGEGPDTRTWITDLRTGATRMVASGWFDMTWDAGNEEIWTVGIVPPGRTWAIGRFTDDGSLDTSTAVRFGGLEEIGTFEGRRSDGDLLVVSMDGLQVISPDRERRDLGHRPGCRDAFAAWSPDGEHFTVTRTCDEERRSGLYVGDSRTGRTRQLVRCACVGTSWSPDGRWVLFDADVNPYAPRGTAIGQASISRKAQYLVRADGSHLGRVSPDGEWHGVWVRREPTEPRGDEAANSGTLAPQAMTRG